MLQAEHHRPFWSWIFEPKHSFHERISSVCLVADHAASAPVFGHHNFSMLVSSLAAALATLSSCDITWIPSSKRFQHFKRQLELSWNEVPAKPSKSLEQFSIETLGDLGTPHFKNPKSKHTSAAPQMLYQCRPGPKKILKHQETIRTQKLCHGHGQPTYSLDFLGIFQQQTTLGD
jgi:hypothetical protein